MTRFNTPQPGKPKAAGNPLTTAAEPTLKTGNNAPGYKRDIQAELFLLAVSNFHSQDTSYEGATERDERYRALVRNAVVIDAQWTRRFLSWLRNDANMRTAAIVGAVEAVRQMRAQRIPGGRALIDSVLVRADEPGELLAYQLATYGRSIPKPIKRGVADAVARLYTQRNALKYDTRSKGLSFGDVIELTHPSPQFHFQGELFQYLLARGQGRKPLEIPQQLVMLRANAELRQQAISKPEILFNPTRLELAGMGWEDVLSLGGKTDKRRLWEAIIPSMGYMALLRNLRNFDAAGIGKDFKQRVHNLLVNPTRVAQSRQLPMRFLSAYRSMVSDTWNQTLELALQESLASVPALPGNTLILIDASASMSSQMTDKSGLNYHDAAVIFGLALAQRCRDKGGNVDVVSFSSWSQSFPAVAGESLLRGIKRWGDGGFFTRGGTDTPAAVTKYFVPGHHHRVVILTDEQYGSSSGWGTPKPEAVFAKVPPGIPAITFNLAGYEAAHTASSPTRITIGGLSDKAFMLLPVLEDYGKGRWPF